MTLASLRPRAIGIAAALRVPFWVHGSQLRRVLDGGDASADHQSADVPTATKDPELELALRVSNAGLRVLGRLRPVWRNTCLYRSIAQWLVLRAYGRRATVTIGVRSAHAAVARAVEAHAWVDYAGPGPVEMPVAGYETLRERS